VIEPALKSFCECAWVVVGNRAYFKFSILAFCASPPATTVITPTVSFPAVCATSYASIRTGPPGAARYSSLMSETSRICESASTCRRNVSASSKSFLRRGFFHFFFETALQSMKFRRKKIFDISDGLCIFSLTHLSRANARAAADLSVETRSADLSGPGFSFCSGQGVHLLSRNGNISRTSFKCFLKRCTMRKRTELVFNF
jgi:hypothetical protein